MVTQEMLEAAMVEAVKRGVFAKDDFHDQYLKAWDDLRAVLEAAQQSVQRTGGRHAHKPVDIPGMNIYCGSCGELLTRR